MTANRLKRRGYVLLVTLILVAIATLALVGASRVALRQAASSIDAERELQRRWGILGCNRVLLPRAEDILNSRRKLRSEPVASVRCSLEMGGQQFELVLADEQAKVNVNTLLSQGTKRDAEDRLRKLLTGTGLTTHIRLQPELSGDNQEAGIESLGQVFDLLPSSGKLIKDPDPATDRLTCWGSGALNFRRADQRGFRELCIPTLDLFQIEQLIRMRDQTPPVPLREALDQLQLSAERRSVAERLLTDRSQCHSLWVLVHDGERIDYHLAVLQEGAGGSVVMRRFEY